MINNANKEFYVRYDISDINTNIDNIELSKIDIINCVEYNYIDKNYGNTYHRLKVKIVFQSKKEINILSNYEYKSNLEQKLVELLHSINILNKNKSYKIYSYCKNNNILLFRMNKDVNKKEIKNLSL